MYAWFRMNIQFYNMMFETKSIWTFYGLDPSYKYAACARLDLNNEYRFFFQRMHAADIHCIIDRIIFSMAGTAAFFNYEYHFH